MKTIHYLPILVAFPFQAFALLSANDLQGRTGRADLTYDRMIVQVGPQWMDVEEEAEIQVVPDRDGPAQNWIVEGTFHIPKGSAVIGCMLWNDEVLLMGKLRGRADAQKIFDSLVPPRPPTLARDPLLIEQLDDTTYGLHLFPFPANGSRRFRLRYLVPLNAGQSSFSVKPLFAKSVPGRIPKQFRLVLKGNLEMATLERGSLRWPAEFPSTQLVDLDANSDVRLLWTNDRPGDATRATRGHIDSGAWKGDFVLYTGKVPDSILSKTALKSETVVLWKWIQPRMFVNNCGYGYSCLSQYGNLAVQQAQKIKEISEHLTNSGNKVGLVADQGLADSTICFPLSDSGSRENRQMKQWLNGINEGYLKSILPAPDYGTGSGFTSNLDIGKSRQRFRTDIRQAAAMYSADSGIIRHLVVVTVGPDAPNAYLEPFDTTLLPKNVSIGSSQLVGRTYWDNSKNPYQFVAEPAPSTWPGVDLAGIVNARSGGTKLFTWNGIALPRSRDSLSGRLSFQSTSGRISRNIVVRKAPDGNLVASMNVHGTDISKQVTWTLFDENGATLRSWNTTPDWLVADGDSLLPRLWAKSEVPISPVFEDRALAPIFGVVDPFYSLLATPADSLGRDRQSVLRDSGVPFLSSLEIFPRQGYGGEEVGVMDRQPVANSLKLTFDMRSRTIRIDIRNLSINDLEIVDLRGRVMASWTKSQLAGVKILEWRLPNGSAKGLLLVRAHTAAGIASNRIFLN